MVEMEKTRGDRGAGLQSQPTDSTMAKSYLEKEVSTGLQEKAGKKT